MKLPILNINGQATGREAELSDAVFGIEPNQHAVYLAVKLYLANQRQGTHKAKERSEVSGSTRKLHRQKGTGGSRKGDINNPLYPGGGRVFGPRPRDYSFKLNKKVKQLARKAVLSAKAQQGGIIVVEDFTFAAPKTKEFVSVLRNLEIADSKNLFVLPNTDINVLKSARNVERNFVVRSQDLNVYDLMNCNTLVVSESALQHLNEALA